MKKRFTFNLTILDCKYAWAADMMNKFNTFNLTILDCKSSRQG